LDAYLQPKGVLPPERPLKTGYDCRATQKICSRTFFF
jgi:hypothetical protein